MVTLDLRMKLGYLRCRNKGMRFSMNSTCRYKIVEIVTDTKRKDWKTLYTYYNKQWNCVTNYWWRFFYYYIQSSQCFYPSNKVFLNYFACYIKWLVLFEFNLPLERINKYIFKCVSNDEYIFLIGYSSCANQWRHMEFVLC